MTISSGRREWKLLKLRSKVQTRAIRDGLRGANGKTVYEMSDREIIAVYRRLRLSR